MICVQDGLLACQQACQSLLHEGVKPSANRASQNPMSCAMAGTDQPSAESRIMRAREAM